MNPDIFYFLFTSYISKLQIFVISFTNWIKMTILIAKQYKVGTIIMYANVIHLHWTNNNLHSKLTWVGYPFQSTCQTYGRIYLQRLKIICFDDHDQNNNKVFFREINNVPSFQDQGKIVNYQDPCAWFTNAYLRTLQWTFHNIWSWMILAILIHEWFY